MWTSQWCSAELRMDADRNGLGLQALGGVVFTHSIHKQFQSMHMQLRITRSHMFTSVRKKEEQQARATLHK
jgi:hypothetical protein